MYVIEKLRLNKFENVVIPSRRQLYEKLGPQMVASPSSSDDAKVFSYPVNKADLMNKSEQLKTGYDVQLALNKIRDAKATESQTVTTPVENPTDTHATEVKQNPNDL